MSYGRTGTMKLTSFAIMPTQIEIEQFNNFPITDLSGKQISPILRMYSG